jgi:hypothetical protein
MIKKLVAAALVAAALPVAAGAVTYADSEPQVSTGQDFVFSFAGVATPTTGGTFTVTARGDYTLGFPGIEYLSYDLEGLTGDVAPETPGATYTSFSFDDTEFSFTVALTLAQLLAITADNAINIGINLPGDINAFAPSAYVAVDVTYNGTSGAVPEPATWAMMIGGMALVGASMRRRRTAVSFA